MNLQNDACCRVGRFVTCIVGEFPTGIPTMKPPATGRCFAITAGCFCPVFITFAQETSPTPSPDRSGVTVEEVIVTGSNIPTSEEVGPNPVDTYRREDII